MAEFPTFNGLWPWPWPWIRSYCIPSCITHRPLPTHQISLKLKKHFVDGRTYGRADGHLRPTLLGRLRGVDLKITKTTFQREWNTPSTVAIVIKIKITTTQNYVNNKHNNCHKSEQSPLTFNLKFTNRRGQGSLKIIGHGSNRLSHITHCEHLVVKASEVNNGESGPMKMRKKEGGNGYIQKRQTQQRLKSCNQADSSDHVQVLWWNKRWHNKLW